MENQNDKPPAAPILPLTDQEPIMPGERRTIGNATVPFALQGKRLWIGGATSTFDRAPPGSWLIHAMRIAGIDQISSVAPLPGDLFPYGGKNELSLDVANIGERVELDIENTSAEPLLFSGSLLGDQVGPQVSAPCSSRGPNPRPSAKTR